MADAIRRCRTAGIRVFMVTGDYALTAEAIAHQVGLFTGAGRVILGDELERLSEDDLIKVLGARELVFARISPLQKLRIVRTLQHCGEIVTVTGDGVNDAPALKNADMGVAMGRMGTEVAKESSRMVLLDDNFATIVAAVEQGRTIFDNLKKFIGYVLSHTVPEILPFVAFILWRVPLPLTVMLILCIDLGTDILPALGLGIEPAEDDVMRRPPRPRSERLLTAGLLLNSYGVSGVFQSAAAFTGFFATLYAGGWQWGAAVTGEDPSYRNAVTAYFAAVVICQCANALIRRTRRESLFGVGIFSNPLVNIGIAAALLFVALIAYVPVLNRVFGTAPLSWWQWLLPLPFAVLMLAGSEVVKALMRHRQFPLSQ